MRYGIFADIHSNLEALEAVLEAYKKETIDKYLCLGDVVGYATNPKECINKIRALAMVTVAGNHDWGSVSLLSADYFNPEARQAISWTKDNLDNEDKYFLESLKLTYKNDTLTLVHGTLNDPQDFNYMTDDFSALDTFRLLETNICFIAHTHVAGAFIKDKSDNAYYCLDEQVKIKNGNKYIINVGSVGQPRDGNPCACYCVYDTDKKEAQIKRVSYDIKAARKKIIAAGLPRFLGDRLVVGR
jgi:predicted phosphodiesterase